MEYENTEAGSAAGNLNDNIAKIRNTLGELVIGQTEMLDLLIAALLADGHVLIEGVPGVAKTLTAKMLSRCLDAKFSRIQFTPDIMPSDVLGTAIFNPKTTDFEFKPGPVFAQVILVDEINRAPAKTQSALFEVMEERQVTMDGITYRMEEPFFILATQNPIEHEGTYRLPEAQLDRFIFKIQVPYPNLEEELQILSQHHNVRLNERLEAIPAILTVEQIQEARAFVRGVFIEEHLLKFIAQIVQETRSHKDIFLGASPRASLALASASKAIAVLEGRDFVTPDDIVRVAAPVLRHRIMLTPEKEMEGQSTDDMISRIIQKLEVPR